MGLTAKERKLKRQPNNAMAMSQDYHPLCIGIKYKNTVLCIHNMNIEVLDMSASKIVQKE